MTVETGEGTLAADLAARVESLPALVNGDARLVERGRFLSVDLLLELGRTPYYIAIEHGRIASLERGPLPLRSWRFAIRAGEEVWRRFWREMPAPGEHDLFALAKRGQLSIEGDLHPFMANLFYFKELLAAPRGQRSAA
ncbi:MAG TPA: hypothetical protein VN668_12780 [Stellaceae bacterium]|nr:hypothetical protein [Stellaceae bacterium]